MLFTIRESEAGIAVDVRCLELKRRFEISECNRGQIIMGSATVLINGKGAARNGDTANTCNDPADMPVGTVIAVGTVLIGG